MLILKHLTESTSWYLMAGMLFQILAVDDLQKMEMRLMLKFGTDSIISIIACTSIMLTILLISAHLYALVKNISSFHKKR